MTLVYQPGCFAHTGTCPVCRTHEMPLEPRPCCEIDACSWCHEHEHHDHLRACALCGCVTADVRRVESPGWEPTVVCVECWSDEEQEGMRSVEIAIESEEAELAREFPRLYAECPECGHRGCGCPRCDDCGERVDVRLYDVAGFLLHLCPGCTR